MKTAFLRLAAAALLIAVAPEPAAQTAYEPSAEVRESQARFADDRFGIFIHWGIYSMFGQGEWYLNNKLTHEEYSKAAAAFYPARFDAREWVSAIKASGARYITVTTRHHDGFSMWHTAQSPYNIVDATPFGRDVLRELADECHRQGISLHLYYSHIDWGREDYPKGRTGNNTGLDKSKEDWNSYYGFMNRQLTELLTGYGPVRAIWFDGKWDHDSDSTAFDWQLDGQYAMIHRLQPGCMIANNHHETPFAGEDIQIFERDLPGENTAGLSGQQVSRLPLETCNTMNGMWGYKVADQNYKDATTLIRYLVKAAGMGANLLLNIGPQPSGELPAAALERLRDMGEWLGRYGTTVYGTSAGDFPAQPWGTSTRRGDRLYVHVFDSSSPEIVLPMTRKVLRAVTFDDGKEVTFSQTGGRVTLTLAEAATDRPDNIIELTTE